MFVFRLHQNEYSAIIAAQNSDLIGVLGFSSYRGEKETRSRWILFTVSVSLSDQPLVFLIYHI